MFLFYKSTSKGCGEPSSLEQHDFEPELAHDWNSHLEWKFLSVSFTLNCNGSPFTQSE